MLKRICVYCGGLQGKSSVYVEAATLFGKALVKNNIDLVYGGGQVGLMGAVADAVLADGGEAIGVMPRSLVEREIAHKGLTDLKVVDTMHERKAMMADLSDAFVALPGGYGTLEELFETITLTIIEAHSKPCGILNVGGYYDRLLGLLDHVCEEGFITKEDKEFLVVDSDPDVLIERLKVAKPYKSTRWKVMKENNS